MDSLVKILLAEDEPALGQIVKESLETKGFHVLFCKDGLEALEVYYKEKPQLLVLDVMMPKKDGFTLAREIRMQDEHIPIIFLTAKSQTQDVVEGFTAGGNDYLKKPSNFISESKLPHRAGFSVHHPVFAHHHD